MIGKVEYVKVFFFNDTATTEIYTLSLRDTLPIFRFGGEDPVLPRPPHELQAQLTHRAGSPVLGHGASQEVTLGQGEAGDRSEEHTSELQSRQYLVCRLLLEKQNNLHTRRTSSSTL